VKIKDLGPHEAAFAPGRAPEGARVLAGEVASKFEAGPWHF
jgi:hypothetical protein